MIDKGKAVNCTYCRHYREPVYGQMPVPRFFRDGEMPPVPLEPTIQIKDYWNIYVPDKEAEGEWKRRGSSEEKRTVGK